MGMNIPIRKSEAIIKERNIFKRRKSSSSSNSGDEQDDEFDLAVDKIGDVQKIFVLVSIGSVNVFIKYCSMIGLLKGSD
jgi:hypothetical protein